MKPIIPRRLSSLHFPFPSLFPLHFPFLLSSPHNPFLLGSCGSLSSGRRHVHSLSQVCSILNFFSLFKLLSVSVSLSSDLSTLRALYLPPSLFVLLSLSPQSLYPSLSLCLALSSLFLSQQMRALYLLLYSALSPQH
ncbi:hypothetical protein AMTRI_Chr02g259160 [Amborella trichopoda]